MSNKTALLTVLDGVGVGALPDAAQFGDEGANTLGHIDERVGGLRLPVMESLGLGWIKPLSGVRPVETVKAWWGRMAEKAAGKDSTAGHWELTGVIVDTPFATFPKGFPTKVMEAFCDRTGLPGWLGNKTASGTGIIDELGEEHLKTGKPIVYTSADSVFQIAAHDAVISKEKLYQLCEIAFDLVAPLGVGRVIARPFVGEPGDFTRTEFRKDFSVAPPKETLLDRLTVRGVHVYGIGKVDNLFAGRGFFDCHPVKDNNAGIDEMIRLLGKSSEACGSDRLIFTNLGDFDTKYGHRKDVKGFAKALEKFDERLPEVLDLLGGEDLMVITADHGNDPVHPGYDHTREEVPLLVTNERNWMGKGASSDQRKLGLRESFADVGATLAEFFGLKADGCGVSFLRNLM